MNTPQLKPMLVTGSPRSGSTWVGRMLALSPQVQYVAEPFNPKHSKGVCSADFPYFYTYISQVSEKQDYYHKHLQKTVNLSYNFSEALRDIKDWESFKKCLREWRDFRKSRLQNAISLIKDPIAIFSSEWLAQTFELRVLVLIRHPAAYVASKKKAGWRFCFRDFLAQPQLIQDYLYPYKDQIIQYAAQPPSLLEEGVFLWNIIYKLVRQFQVKHEDWLFIRHEDLSENPVVEFENLYYQLGLNYTPEIKKTISQYSGDQNTNNTFLRNAVVKRDSKANIYSWKKRLTPDEIQYIKQETQAIAQYFYTDEDW